MRRMDRSGSVEQFPSLLTTVGEQPQTHPVSVTLSSLRGCSTCFICCDLHLVLLWLIYMFYLGNVSDQQLNWRKWSRNRLLLRVKCSDDKGMLLEFIDSITDAMSPCNSENLESCLVWMTLLRSFDPTMGTCGTLKTTNNFQHKDICQDSQWCQSPIPFK